MILFQEQRIRLLQPIISTFCSFRETNIQTSPLSKTGWMFEGTNINQEYLVGRSCFVLQPRIKMRMSVIQAVLCVYLLQDVKMSLLCSSISCPYHQIKNGTHTTSYQYITSHKGEEKIELKEIFTQIRQQRMEEGDSRKPKADYVPLLCKDLEVTNHRQIISLNCMKV